MFFLIFGFWFLSPESWFLRGASSSVGQSTRLISVGSEVQVLPGPPFPSLLFLRGCSSVGRARALQA